MTGQKLVLPLALLLVGLGCGQDAPQEATTPEPAKEAPATPDVEPEPVVTKEKTSMTLLDPAAFNEVAPDTYAVTLTTTKGDVIIDVTRAWSPNGADRFYNLVKGGYYNDVAFFRVISGFMAQVGMHGEGPVNAAWRSARIQDDPVTESNTRGMVTFATSGPNSRTTQFFINFRDNKNLDAMGFSPFGKVRDMAVVDALHSDYGEGAPRGRGPSQGKIMSDGNAYLRAEFPNLDYIVKAELLP